MRTAPGSSTEDDLDLLTTGETAHGVVGDKLGFETEIGEVLLDLTTDERAEQTSTLSLSGVDLKDLLLEATLDEVVARKPDVLRGAEALERHLVLIRLLELLPVEDLLDEALLTFDDNERSILHLLLLLLGDLSVGLHQLLEILSGLVAPEHVFEGSLVEMMIDVMESMLSDIADDQVGVLPDLATLVGLHVTDEKLDESRFTGTVGTKHSDAR